VEYKYAKLRFGPIIVTTALSSITIDCPNEYGGIGDLSCEPLEDIWAGTSHIHTDKIGISFYQLTCVELGNDWLCEEAPWKTIWVANEKTSSYRYWENVATLIRCYQVEE